MSRIKFSAPVALHPKSKCPTPLPPSFIVDSHHCCRDGIRQDQSTDQQLVEIRAFCAKHGLILWNYAHFVLVTDME